MEASIHTPERLAGESLTEYKSRRRMSRRLAERPTLIWSSSVKGAYFKPGSTSKQKRPAIRRKKEKVPA